MGLDAFQFLVRDFPLVGCTSAGRPLCCIDSPQSAPLTNGIGFLAERLSDFCRGVRFPGTTTVNEPAEGCFNPVESFNQLAWFGSTRLVNLLRGLVGIRQRVQSFSFGITESSIRGWMKWHRRQAESPQDMCC